MILVAAGGSGEVHRLVVASAAGFREPFGGRPYTCLLWDAIGTTDDGERARLSAALIASGCVYAVCGGIGCEAWHDAIDEALAAMQAEGRLPDDHFVTTTWHAGEPIADVAEFFVRSAMPSAGPVDRHLVLQIGRDPDLRNELSTSVRGCVLDG